MKNWRIYRASIAPLIPRNLPSDLSGAGRRNGRSGGTSGRRSGRRLYVGSCRTGRTAGATQYQVAGGFPKNGQTWQIVC